MQHIPTCFSLVVPAYNEEDNILPFFEECVSSFSESSLLLEIIFVDDGSSDKTYLRMEEAVNRASSVCDLRLDVTALSFSRNFGKEAAMYAGLEHANGDYICFIDSDLQQKPETARAMLAALCKNPEYDCVAAFQESRSSSLTSRLSSWFYSLLSRSSGMSVVNDASDFRVFTRGVADALLSMREYHRFSKGLFAWVGFKTLPFAYVPSDRLAGESTWSIKKLFSYALEGLIAFTTFPLRIATALGIISSVGSFLYMLIVLVQRLIFGVDVPGYATIVILILFMGGVQLLMLGIVGEYLARMYVQGKQRPIYILRRQVSSQKDN